MEHLVGTSYKNNPLPILESQTKSPTVLKDVFGIKDIEIYDVDDFKQEAGSVWPESE